MPDSLQEDRGLVRVHAACVDMHAVWRPTPCHDLGVDGQIEFLEQTDSVTSTGQIIAVQVKSGPSYFKHEDAHQYKYYPSAKHVRYWHALNVPLLLVLHNPTDDLTVYSEVKPQLETDGPILVPKANVLSRASRNDILEICGRVDNPKRILKQLKNVSLTVEADKSITGIEFLISCLSPNHEYFELRMARLQAIIELAIENGIIGIGNDTCDFIHRCSMMCMAANITETFAETYDHQWYDMKLVPDVTVALTPFGTVVADCLRDNAVDYVSSNAFAHNAFGDATHIYLRLQSASQSISDHIDGKDALYCHPR